MRAYESKISARQLWFSILLMLLADMVTKPHTASISPGAQGMVLGVGIDLLLLSAVTAYFLWAVRPFQKELSCPQKENGSLPIWLLLLPLLLSAGESITQANRFYRFVSEEYIPAWAFTLLFLGVAFYGSFLGLETLARSSLPIAVLLAGSFLFLLIANIRQCAVENLQFSEHLLRDTAQAAVLWFHIPAELFLYGMLQARTTGKSRLHLQGAFWVFGILFFLAIMLEELVLGPFAATQQQPLHTLARIGSLSVFTRLDALHVSVWMLLSLLRISFYCWGVLRLVQGLLPQKKEKSAGVAFLLLLAAVVGAHLCGDNLMQKLITAAGLFTAVFLPLCLQKKKERGYV